MSLRSQVDPPDVAHQIGSADTRTIHSVERRVPVSSSYPSSSRSLCLHAQTLRQPSEAGRRSNQASMLIANPFLLPAVTAFRRGQSHAVHRALVVLAARNRGRLRDPYGTPLRDGNRDRLYGLLTQRSVATLLHYLSVRVPCGLLFGGGQAPLPPCPPALCSIVRYDRVRSPIRAPRAVAKSSSRRRFGPSAARPEVPSRRPPALARKDATLSM